MANYQLRDWICYSYFLSSVFGQCDFDPKCFRYSVGCTLMNAFPYERKAPVSCTECLKRCLQQQYGPGPFCCRAAVYDWRYQTCDLFAVNAMMQPYRLTKMYGRCYFQPTGCCSVSTPAPATQAPAQSCPSGQTAKMIAVKDYQYPGLSGTTITSSGPEACAQVCLRNQLPNGKTIDCKAAQYEPSNQCIISTSQASGAEGTVQPMTGFTYYQKLCFPTSSVANCPDIFEEDPQHILVGQNRQTVDASSIQDCIQKCLDSQKEFGFSCKSGMYFYEGAQLSCILNTESKSTKPDLFTTAQADKVTYFEPGCNGGTKYAIVAKSLKALDIVKDLPTGQWTLWSPCTGDPKKQYRFLPCEMLDPRKCDKQDRSCYGDDNLDEDKAWLKNSERQRKASIHDGNAAGSFTPCKATFKNGQKNCTFGMQAVDGQMAYCYEPVDKECIKV